MVSTKNYTVSYVLCPSLPIYFGTVDQSDILSTILLVKP